MKNFAYLFWAYAAFWGLLAGYLLFLILRLRGVERRIHRVERALEDRQRSDAS